MNVLQFIAPNAAAALEQIHKQLGPEAVVLSVRPLPAQGVARFLSKPGRIEVLAGLPEPDAGGAARPAIPNHVSHFTPRESNPSSAGNTNSGSSSSDRWQSVAWLEAMGLFPEHGRRLQAHVSTLHGAVPPDSLESEWNAVSASLNQFWRPAPAFEEDFVARPHVFIGPPGSGKTTALCKWLTLATLMEEKAARVFRLDGSSANTADYLAIHCEMLGTPVERVWSPPGNRAELIFIDLPGIDARDPQALNALRSQLATLPNPHVHVVLNAAYETPTLLAQCRAFSDLEPHDIIFTHLDEEPRRPKLWNFAFAGNTPIRFLSAGQKIPGEFHKAAPELLFAS
jgi:flagellar biosynthesis protein FlhF